MAMEDFIEPLKFSVVVDTAEYENKMKQAKLLARDSKKEISQDTKLKLEVDIAQLQFQLQKAKEMLKNATNDSTKFSLQLQTNELQRNLTEAKRSLNNFLNTWDINKSRLWVLFEWIGSLWETLLSWWVIAWVTALSNTVINLAWNLQQARIAFWVMLWSAWEAEVLLKNLSDFAKNTPFELTGLREQAKSLLAFWFSAQDIIPLLTTLGNISAWVGTDKLPRLTYALWQIKAQWILAGTELRQLTETWVPVLEELAKVTWYSTKEIVSNTKDLWISYDQVRQALDNLSSGNGQFTWLMEAQSKTLKGAFSNLKDNLNILWEQIGTIFIPALTGITQWLSSVSQRFVNLSKESPTLTKAVALVSSAFALLLVWLGSYVVLWPLVAWITASIWVSFLTLLWPIWLLISWIFALAQAYDTNFLWFADFVNKRTYNAKIFFEFATLVFDKIGSSINDLSSTMSESISNIINAFSSFSVVPWPLQAIFSTILKIVKENVFPILNIISSLISAIWTLPWVSSLLSQAKFNIDQKEKFWEIQGKSPFKTGAFFTDKITNPQLPKTPWPWWWWKWKTPEQTAKEELERQIKLINDEADARIQSLWKTEKARKNNADEIIRIDTEREKKIKEISWKWAENIVKDTKSIYEKTAKVIKDYYGDINKAIDDSKKKVDDYKKWIKDLNKDIEDLTKDKNNSIASRVAEIDKTLNDVNTPLDSKERDKLVKEKELAFKWLSDQEKKDLQVIIDKAKEIDSLWEIGKIQNDFNEKKKLLDQQIKEKTDALAIETWIYEELTKSKIQFEKEYTSQLDIEVWKQVNIIQWLIDKMREAKSLGALTWLWATIISNVDNSINNTNSNNVSTGVWTQINNNWGSGNMRKIPTTLRQ